MSDLRELQAQVAFAEQRINLYVAEIVSLRAKLESAQQEVSVLRDVLMNPHPDQEPDNIRLHREKCDALERLDSARKALERIANDKKVTEFQSNPHNHPRYIARHALTDEDPK